MTAKVSEINAMTADIRRLKLQIEKLENAQKTAAAKDR